MRQLPIISELFRNIHVRYACIKEKWHYLVNLGLFKGETLINNIQI